MIGFFQRWADHRRAIVLQAFTFPRAPLSSFEIVDRVNADPGNRFFVWSGGVYRALWAIEREGLAISYNRDGRARRYYELTDLGVAERAAINEGRTL
jgi:DNA-binding PadR family transcriptional regulator